jgi:hypothetical protein
MGAFERPPDASLFLRWTKDAPKSRASSKAAIDQLAETWGGVQMLRRNFA